MLELFRRHLEPAAGKGYHIEDCVPLRFRCRQSTARCVLQYTLGLLEPGTGRRWEQGVTGLVYAQQGAAERLWRGRQGPHPLPRTPVRRPPGGPRWVTPLLAGGGRGVPYDRKPRKRAAPVGRPL